MSDAPSRAKEHQAFVDGKRRSRMESVDRLPSDIRPLVHAYGLNVVRAYMDCGVTKARHIRHLVETVLDEFSPTRGSFSQQGPSSDLNRVDHETARHDIKEPACPA